MTAGQVDTSYEPFSREPEYIEGNREFLRELPFTLARRVLDLACGTGTITDLIIETQPDITVFGVDLSRESLTLGRQDFLSHGMSVRDNFVLTRGAARLVLIEGTADRVPLRDGWAEI